MEIVDFSLSHIEEAQRIALQNYNVARDHVSALPEIDEVPGLSAFAESGLGVAAFSGDTMDGFLCCVPPFQNAFGSTDATGVFSPMGANGAIGENRPAVYARMVQAAGAKWARAGASSHAVCLYAHDMEIQEQFFRYGYGLRCIDAVRAMNAITAPDCPEYDFEELDAEAFLDILPLDRLLGQHIEASPCFILRPSDTEESFAEMMARFQPTIFVARKAGQIVAYIRAELDGETFVCETPGYLHVKGAFCLPEHRGKGVMQKLLSLLVEKLQAQGYSCLGVDFESINPAAYGFWLKHFDAYTHSVVRRIDEHAVLKYREVMSPRRCNNGFGGDSFA